MERQKKILKEFKKICDCVACVKNYPLIPNLRSDGERSIMFEHRRFEKVLDLEDDDINSFRNFFKSNCHYINDNFHKFPCQEVALRMSMNLYLLNKD